MYDKLGGTEPVSSAWDDGKATQVPLAPTCSAADTALAWSKWTQRDDWASDPPPPVLAERRKQCLPDWMPYGSGPSITCGIKDTDSQVLTLDFLIW